MKKKTPTTDTPPTAPKSPKTNVTQLKMTTITAVKILGEHIVRAITVAVSLSDDVAALRAEVAALSAKMDRIEQAGGDA